MGGRTWVGGAGLVGGAGSVGESARTSMVDQYPSMLVVLVPLLVLMVVLVLLAVLVMFLERVVSDQRPSGFLLVMGRVGWAVLPLLAW